jgi:hypothetical protein
VKPLNEALKIVTQEDVELAKKAPVRTAEQGVGSDIDSANLMGLLGDIDGLKNEIHERMRRIEAVKQAKSVLQEDAERTEALNRRLAEIGKAMTVAQSGFQSPEIGKEAAEPVRMQPRESVVEAEPRTAPAKVPSEGVALPWLVTEEPSELSEPSQLEEVQEEPAAKLPEEVISIPEEEPQVTAEASIAFEAAFKRLEQNEESRMQAWTRADEAVQEAKRLLDDATAQLQAAVGREEQASQAFYSAQESLTATFQSAQERLAEAERAREAARVQIWKEVEDSEKSQEAARIHAWKQANEAAQEAKRLLDETTSKLNLVVDKEEQATQEFNTARESLAIAYRAATERLEEAERSWKNTDQAVLEAKRLLEQSTAELVQARKKEESIAANLQSVREEFTAAYQSASQRLQEAEQFVQRGGQAAKEAQQLIDQTTAELLLARKAEETAAADLLSARQELTTAYQFAAVAAQRRLDAVDSYNKASRWAVFAVALSWLAMAWMAWFAFQTKMPFWVPCIVTVILIGLAVKFAKQGTRES